MRVRVPLLLAKVASHPWNVLITAIPFLLQDVPAKPSLSGKRSPVTAWFSFSFLGTPIQLLKSVMMQGVLLFGVPWSVFLSHTARQHGVSVQVALLLASSGFGGQYITIAVMSSCQFRSLMAPALPCTFGSASTFFYSQGWALLRT